MNNNISYILEAYDQQELDSLNKRSLFKIITSFFGYIGRRTNFVANFLISIIGSVIIGAVQTFFKPNDAVEIWQSVLQKIVIFFITFVIFDLFVDFLNRIRHKNNHALYILSWIKRHHGEWENQEQVMIETRKILIKYNIRDKYDEILSYEIRKCKLKESDKEFSSQFKHCYRQAMINFIDYVNDNENIDNTDKEIIEATINNAIKSIDLLYV